MNLVLLTHPEFLGLRSQDHFARMLVDGYRARGHAVDLRRPRAWVKALIPSGRWSKWAGYVDQYLLFPLALRRAMQRDPPDTLYVFCDQALGPWVPLAAHRPHVVHCHDLLALQSALGEVPENPTGWTGRLYQRFIRRGFVGARHFISVSHHSRAELHRLGAVAPLTSDVVYNGLNQPWQRIDADTARTRVHAAGLPGAAPGLLLHVGGGQWYKNTAGVLALYRAHAARCVAQGRSVPPLWLVGPRLPATLQAQLLSLPAGAVVQQVGGVGGEVLEALYSLAAVMLFPSLAEGFGWPIIEAMACGCAVLTTDAAPMNEVAGSMAAYVPRLESGAPIEAWAELGADQLARLTRRTEREVACDAAAAQDWARRFDANVAIDRYLTIYAQVASLNSTALDAGFPRVAS
ncbi:MAG: glycosyltransferase [Leptothrix sp. (in: b-proteobacteria)]